MRVGAISPYSPSKIGALHGIVCTAQRVLRHVCMHDVCTHSPRAALRRPFRLLRAQRVGPFLCGYSEVPAVCGRLVLCAAVGGQRAGRRLHARLLFCTHSNSLSHLAAGSSTNPGTRWITHARTFSSHSSPRKPGRQRHSIESADGEPAPVSAEHVWPFAHGHVLGRICSSTCCRAQPSTVEPSAAAEHPLV
jgi:hypothetical protein